MSDIEFVEIACPHLLVIITFSTSTCAFHIPCTHDAAASIAAYAISLRRTTEMLSSLVKDRCSI